MKKTRQTGRWALLQLVSSRAPRILINSHISGENDEKTDTQRKMDGTDLQQTHRSIIFIASRKKIWYVKVFYSMDLSHEARKSSWYVHLYTLEKVKQNMGLHEEKRKEIFLC